MDSLGPFLPWIKKRSSPWRRRHKSDRAPPLCSLSSRGPPATRPSVHVNHSVRCPKVPGKGRKTRNIRTTSAGRPGLSNIDATNNISRATKPLGEFLRERLLRRLRYGQIGLNFFYWTWFGRWRISLLALVDHLNEFKGVNLIRRQWTVRMRSGSGKSRGRA